MRINNIIAPGPLLIIFMLCLVFSSCTGKKEETPVNRNKHEKETVTQAEQAIKPDTAQSQQKKPESKKASEPITVVTNEAHFNTVINSDKERLFIIDFYADWCQPCRILSPMIKEIASEHGDIATFVKVNVDHNRPLAVKYKVSGIPYIVFIKNGAIVHSITGLVAKDTYINAIKKFSKTVS